VGDFPNWSSITDYNPGDVVTYAGELWVAMNSNLNSTPPSSVWSPSNTSNNWVLMNAYYPAPQIYTGNQTQNPDPLIQASEGAANTSAYRGLCHCVFDTLPLQNFGGRIPNLRAEVTFTKVNNVL
jgi:hypothetical protein